jgi:hypothetical protein
VGAGGCDASGYPAAKELEVWILKMRVARENNEERKKIISEEYGAITKAWLKGVATAGGCFKLGPLAGVCEALIEPDETR